MSSKSPSAIVWTKYRGIQTRRMKREGKEMPFSLEEFSALVDRAVKIGKCFYCNELPDYYNFSPDHRLATLQGGSDELSNLRIICWPCNDRKRGMSDYNYAVICCRARLEIARGV